MRLKRFCIIFILIGINNLKSTEDVKFMFIYEHIYKIHEIKFPTDADTKGKGGIGTFCYMYKEPIFKIENTFSALSLSFGYIDWESKWIEEDEKLNTIIRFGRVNYGKGYRFTIKRFNLDLGAYSSFIYEVIERKGLLHPPTFSLLSESETKYLPEKNFHIRPGVFLTLGLYIGETSMGSHLYIGYNHTFEGMKTILIGIGR